MNGDLWDKVRDLDSETWKVCLALAIIQSLFFDEFRARNLQYNEILSPLLFTMIQFCTKKERKKRDLKVQLRIILE